MIWLFSSYSKTLVGWETSKFGSDLTYLDWRTEISQSPMIVVLNAKVLLKKLKRSHHVATDVNCGGIDHVGALMKRFCQYFQNMPLFIGIV